MFDFVSSHSNQKSSTIVWKQDRPDDPDTENVYWVHIRDGEITDIVVEVYDWFHHCQVDHHLPTDEEKQEVSRLSIEEYRKMMLKWSAENGNA